MGYVLTIGIVTILLLGTYCLIRKLYGCPNCGSLRKRHLGKDLYDLYPTVECKNCGNIYFWSE
jgi:transcription elongation factor Elf1